MGGQRRAARVLVASLGAMLAAALARPAAAASGTLTLSPTHGQASGSITMTFAYTGPPSCSGASVTFSWDTIPSPLGMPPLSGTCGATTTATPPAGANGAGQHTVTARALSVTVSQPYTIDPPPPTPTPTPRPTPRPTPVPTPTPTPTPTPDLPPPPTPPPPPCDTKVPQSTGGAGYLQVANVPGGTTDPQHAGSVVVSSIAPASMLPPVLGTVPLTEVDLIRLADGSSQALVQAVAGGTHFDCAQLELGPGAQYFYATYAFHDVLFSSYSPTSGGERLTLSYVAVDWEYQLRDGRHVVTGTGRLGDTPHPLSLEPAGMSRIAPVLTVGLAVLAAGGAAGGILAWYRARRRRDRLALGPGEPGGRPPHL